MITIETFSGPLVDELWLARHQQDVAVLDVRWYRDGRNGRDAYDAGHIPGARFVDLDADLAGPPGGGGRHPLPSPEDFASSMGRLGVDNSSTVVAYDDSGGSTAARCWWMLDAVGVAVAVLDGGIAAWPGALETTEPTWDSVDFEPRPWPDTRLVEIDEVHALTSDRGTLIIDARSAERFRGEKDPVDERPGHIPGARSAPYVANIDANGRLLPPADLAARYRSMGAAESSVIAYCGSGVTACHDLLALRAAGLGDGRLFVGSWSAWGADHSRPVETGGG